MEIFLPGFSLNVQDTAISNGNNTPPPSITPSITPSMTPTPTPSPSPTPCPSSSPAPSYELYTADRYDCSGAGNTCAQIETGVQIGNPTVLIEGKFYYDYANSYIFNIVGGPLGGPYAITSMSGLGTNNCSILCSV